MGTIGGNLNVNAFAPMHNASGCTSLPWRKCLNALLITTRHPGAIIAILAIIFVLNKTMTEQTAMAFAGTGVAIAPTCYGIYMMIAGWHLKKPEIF